MRKITKTIRGYTCDWYSERELLKIFYGSKRIISQKAKERQQECEEIKSKIRNILSEVEEISKKDIWFAKICIAIFDLPKLRESEQHLARLKRLLALTKNKKSTLVNDFGEKIESAKNYPIYEMARDKLELRQSGENFIGLCPFHNEKTPSFYIYTKTNTYHCFGCQVHGSVINLTMELNGFDFRQAVEYLQK